MLSPACASFDWYRSYGERGDDFQRAVHALLGTANAVDLMSRAISTVAHERARRASESWYGFLCREAAAFIGARQTTANVGCPET